MFFPRLPTILLKGLNAKIRSKGNCHLACCHFFLFISFDSILEWQIKEGKEHFKVVKSKTEKKISA
jgi:hypothetical protein